MLKRFKISIKWFQVSLIIISLVISLLPINQATAGNVTYVYDELYRLVQVSYDDGTNITYTFDQVGNRLSRDVTISKDTVPTPRNINQDGTEDKE